MIEKLKPRKRDDGFLEPATPSDIHWKINELVDAVNELTSCVGQLGVEFTDETHAENVPGPIKLYVCADGSVYDNLDVAKSHAASIFNPLPAGATTTDHAYLERELNRTRKAVEIAVDALKDIRCVYTGDQTTKPSTMFGRAAGALNKITALEQKDHFANASKEVEQKD